jgi:hypothetical protein
MLKCEGWFQSVRFDKDIHTYENCKKKYELTSKWQFKEGALPFELHTGHVDQHTLSSINKSVDERVSEQDWEK